MDTQKIEKVAAGLPSHLDNYKFTKNDPDNPNPKGNDRDGDGKTNEKKPDWAGKDKKSSGRVAAKGPYTTPAGKRDPRLRQLEEAANKAKETLNFKYDMGLPGGIKQAEKALQRALAELRDYRESKMASNTNGLRSPRDKTAGYYIEVEEDGIDPYKLEDLADFYLDDFELDNFEVHSRDKAGLESLRRELDGDGIDVSRVRRGSLVPRGVVKAAYLNWKERSVGASGYEATLTKGGVLRAKATLSNDGWTFWVKDASGKIVDEDKKVKLFDEIEKRTKKVLDKDKKASERVAGSVVPRGVVAALTFDGEIKIFAADTPEAAHGIKTALMEQEGEFSNIVHGPNTAGRTVNELYDHFEERWAGCEKLPEGPMRDNCEKKKDKGDKKKNKVAREEIPVEQWPDSIMQVARQLGYSYRDIKAVHNSALQGSYNVTLNATSEAITSDQLKRAEKAGLGGILAKVESLLIKG